MKLFTIGGIVKEKQISANVKKQNAVLYYSVVPIVKLYYRFVYRHSADRTGYGR